jgi:hypothetical protein
MGRVKDGAARRSAWMVLMAAARHMLGKRKDARASNPYRPLAGIAVTSSRTPIPADIFDAQRYLAHNRDVAAAVARGETEAYQHYVRYGHSDELAGRRRPSLPLQSP